MHRALKPISYKGISSAMRVSGTAGDTGGRAHEAARSEGAAVATKENEQANVSQVSRLELPGVSSRELEVQQNLVTERCTHSRTT